MNTAARNAEEFESEHAVIDATTKQAHEPTSRTRRSPRACLQCRAKKQKCFALSNETGSPCQRCIYLGAQCSYTEPSSDEVAKSRIDRTDARVKGLQRQLRDHERRLAELEAIILDFRGQNSRDAAGRLQDTPDSRRLENETVTSTLQSPEAPTELASQGSTSLHYQDNTWQHGDRADSSSKLSRPSARLDMATFAGVSLDTPMSTLQHLRAHHDDSLRTVHAVYDPIEQGVLTIEEAQNAFDTFFAHYHRWAPLLCPVSHRSAAAVHSDCLARFTSICAFGLRSRQTMLADGDVRYRRLISLLDASLSRLLLKPTGSDVHLNHIRSLLLYIQWTPLDTSSEPMQTTRYNDVSAWSMLGLAIRYALFMGLHSNAVQPFRPERVDTAKQEDVSRLRVWVNLLTCDSNLMLSSGLPASLNPEPVAAVSRQFSSCIFASQPDDTRAAAISELVAVLKRAARSSGSPNVRSLDIASFRQANAEFDAWEAAWSRILSDEIGPSEMPFTTLRSYRLAVNSACLTSLLSKDPELRQVTLQTLQALEVCLLSATQTIFALSNQTHWRTWTVQTRSTSSLPETPFTLNNTAVGRTSYAPDSPWIMYSFAGVFLCSCYMRGAVNDELEILALQTRQSACLYPNKPRTESLLYRVASLASEIFDFICSACSAHPATHHHSLLSGVFALILGDFAEPGPQPKPSLVSIERDLGTLFDSMVHNPDLNWQVLWT